MPAMGTIDLVNENHNLKRDIDNLREDLRKLMLDKDKYIASNLSLTKQYQTKTYVLRNTLVKCQTELLYLKEKCVTQDISLRDTIAQIVNTKENLKRVENEKLLLALELKRMMKHIKYSRGSLNRPVIAKMKSVKDDSNVLRLIKF